MNDKTRYPSDHNSMKSCKLQSIWCLKLDCMEDWYLSVRSWLLRASRQIDRCLQLLILSPKVNEDQCWKRYSPTDTERSKVGGFTFRSTAGVIVRHRPSFCSVAHCYWYTDSAQWRLTELPCTCFLCKFWTAYLYTYCHKYKVLFEFFNICICAVH